MAKPPATTSSAPSRSSRPSRGLKLGYHALRPGEQTLLNAFFQAAVVLPVSDDVIEAATVLRQRRAMSLGDALIASTAQIHSLRLATHNVKDFDWIGGLVVIDPFA